MIDRVALGTGFRAAELAALIPDHFDLDATPPAVILPPEFSKNRKGAVQPIPADLVAELRVYLRNRPGKDPVWPGTWASRSADMLKLDLTAAGVPVETDGPEGAEVRDFHALRACFISDVLRAGADLKQAMTLARHSDPGSRPPVTPGHGCTTSGPWSINSRLRVSRDRRRKRLPCA